MSRDIDHLDIRWAVIVGGFQDVDEEVYHSEGAENACKMI